MLHAWNRQNITATLPKSVAVSQRLASRRKMRHRFWRMAEYYSTLAEAEGVEHTSLRRLAASTVPTTVRPLKTKSADATSSDRQNT